jgi:Flp pilus assembly protein TadB
VFYCFRGRELARRLASREAEIESDARDRQREKEELEEIRSKVYSDKGCENPSAEFERVSVIFYCIVFLVIIPISLCNTLFQSFTKKRH